MFLICVYGLNARGIQNPNIMVGMLVFFGGICQVFAGLMEFLTGNTVCLLSCLAHKSPRGQLS